MQGSYDPGSRSNGPITGQYCACWKPGWSGANGSPIGLKACSWLSLSSGKIIFREDIHCMVMRAHAALGKQGAVRSTTMTKRLLEMHSVVEPEPGDKEALFRSALVNSGTRSFMSELQGFATQYEASQPKMPSCFVKHQGCSDRWQAALENAALVTPPRRSQEPLSCEPRQYYLLDR